MTNILIIDDQIGGSKAQEESFLVRVGARREVGRKTEPVPDYPYSFAFCSAQTEEGGKVTNSVEAALQKVREGWLTKPTDPSESPRWAAPDGSHWAMVLLDVQFDQSPAGDDDGNFGFVLLNALRREFGSDLPIVMMTQNTSENRRRMANYGEADGFLSKDDLSQDSLAQRLATLGLLEDDRPESVRLVGKSLELLKVLREARRFALEPRGSRIMYGETGSGKTALASYIAHHCHRDGRLITWMAQPANDELNRDQLFGHWCGAFTGAETSEPGAIERAHQGVFLLDEVADLTPAAQQLLLEFRRRDEQGMRRLTRLGVFPTQTKPRGSNAVGQALQSIRGIPYDSRGQQVDTAARQQFAGAVDHIRVDVVLLFATNKPLWQETFRQKEIKFREDLYVELGTLIFFPSLSQRKEDIGPLFRYFLGRFLPNNTPTVNHEVIELLETKRDWANRNVADLIRIAEYTAFAFGKDFSEVLKHHLPQDVRDEAEKGQTATGPRQTALPLPTRPFTPSSLASGPQAPAPAAEDTRCSLAQTEYTRLRERARLLARALDETVYREEATGNLLDYSPKRACDRLYGISVSTTEAKRLVGEIIGSVLEPKDSYERALAPRGLAQCQEEIKGNIALVLWYQWACEVEGFNDDEINERLRDYFQAGSTEEARTEVLQVERERLETEIKLRLEKRRKGKRSKGKDANEGNSGDTQ